MSLKQKFKSLISYILHGNPKPIVAQISYLSPSASLKGRKIAITGGSRGLGFAMAQKFVAEGADVLITGRNEISLKKAAKSIGCKCLLLNMQDIESFDSFMSEADRMLDGIDTLVNNAGISLHEEDFLSVDPTQFESQFNTNLKGPFFLTQCYIRNCLRNNVQGIKKILFTSSETGNTADIRPYGLTKAALNSLVQGLAYRYVSDGFRINAIAPGVTMSDMAGRPEEGTLGIGTWRYFTPEEMAEAATFLISEASNCINGQILTCNEGHTINARWK